MGKFGVAILAFLSVFAPLAARADMIFDGEHVVTRTVQIDNVSDFPLYDVYLATLFKFPGAEKVTSTAPVTVNGGSIRVFAVAKTDNTKVQRDTSDSENFGGWYDLKANANVVVWSSLKINLGPNNIPDTDRTSVERYFIHIDGISGGTMQVRLVRKESVDDKGLLSIMPGGVPATEYADTPYVTTQNPADTEVAPDLGATQQPASSFPNSAAIPVLAGFVGLALGYALKSAWKK